MHKIFPVGIVRIGRTRVVKYEFGVVQTCGDMRIWNRRSRRSAEIARVGRENADKRRVKCEFVGGRASPFQTKWWSHVKQKGCKRAMLKLQMQPSSHEMKVERQNWNKMPFYCGKLKRRKTVVKLQFWKCSILACLVAWIHRETSLQFRYGGMEP